MEVYPGINSSVKPAGSAGLPAKNTKNPLSIFSLLCYIAFAMPEENKTPQTQEIASVEEDSPPATAAGNTTTWQEIQQIKKTVHGLLGDAALGNRTGSLLASIESLSSEMEQQISWSKDSSQKTLEALKKQVEEIESEWKVISASIQAQYERLEAVLHSSPEVMESSALQTLSSRITHLETLISELVNESQSRATSRNFQIFIFSMATLSGCLLLWSICLIFDIL